ncbi:MAG: sensor histidine kinase [Myxococcota bacterium]
MPGWLSRLRLLPNDPELGRMPYLWLMYLAFVFAGPVFAGTDDYTLGWVVTGATVAAFLPLYFAAYWVDGWRRAGLGIAICLLGTLLSTFNTGGNTYFIFGAYFGGYAAPRVSLSPLYLLPSWAALLATAIWVQPSPYFWIPALAGVVVIGLLGVEQRRRAQHNAHLTMARAEVDALARIAERERIARDLHDLLGQSLSLVSIKAELASRLLDGSPERAASELADIQSVSRQALSEVRTAVQGYRIGSGAGLRHELDNARRALTAAGVDLQCDDGLEPLARELDAEHEAVVALALREGVTNVVRHAGAQTCRVSFMVESETFGVEISDDGRGARSTLGYGLSGMRERVESLGGRLEMSGDPGTTLRLVFSRPPGPPPGSSPGPREAA